jgi:multiple sugar transport system substrate-binding protein
MAIAGMLLAACGGSSSQPSAATSAPGGQVATSAPSAATAPAAAEPTTAAGASAPTSAAGATEPTAAAGAATAAPSEQPGAAAGPKLNTDVSGTVEFWHFWSSPVRRNAIRRIIALCAQQLPNVKVNETPKPFGDIWTANVAAVSAGSGMPDVIVEDRPQLPQRAADGIEQSLQELAQRDGIDGSTFWPFTWQQTLYDNQTYGIPFETDVVVLYWNKNAFKEAGLDPEKPPTTWDEVQQYADKLDKKKADGSYERIGFFPLLRAGPETWGYTNGVEWISPDGKPQVNSPQAVETLDWIKQWVDRYGGWQKIQTFRSQFAAPPQDEFMSGKVAMIADINGYSSALNFYRPKVPAANGETANLDWGVSDLPYKKAKGSTSGGFALSIPTGAKNKDAAWEFIKCATGPQAQASWARDTYAMPANQSAAKDPVLLADPNWKLFVDAMSYSSGGNFLKSYPNWKEQLDQRFEKVWAGTLPAKQALDDAEKAIEAGGS